MTSILKVSEIQDPTNSNTALTIDSCWACVDASKACFVIGQSTAWLVHWLRKYDIGIHGQHCIYNGGTVTLAEG